MDGLVRQLGNALRKMGAALPERGATLPEPVRTRAAAALLADDEQGTEHT